jgi:hypothetical protein
MIKQGWLRCVEVVSGMFSDELAVVVAKYNGDEVSYFVPLKDVDEARKCVRVAVRDVGTALLATLPTPDQVTIPVAKSCVMLT